MDREETIALLKEIAVNSNFTVKWLSLVNGKAGRKIRLKPERGDPASLKPFLEKRNLLLKENRGIFVIYREHKKSQ